MLVIFAIDALEYELVEKWDCKNLKQQHYGKTDISEFSEPRTMVLWSSFMTGQNKESEVLGEGNKEMWNKRWKLEETFFSNFDNPKIIDLPGYSYDLDGHKWSRELLKRFFTSDDQEEKVQVRKEYNKDAFDHHRKIKQEFLLAMESGEHDLLLGYFSVVDVIGHLNFGNHTMMKMIYQEFDELAAKIKEMPNVKLLIISDHGMKAIGMFGDHSDYGFWSTNWKDFGEPRITEFFRLLGS